MDVTTRFEDAPWFNGIQSPCTVIGAGSLGSWLTLFLSRAGATVHLWDDDKVEIHNVGGQFYKKDQEGYKVDLCKQNCIEFGATGDIITYKEKFTEGDILVGPVFSCVDSMSSRRSIFSQFKLFPSILIDGGLYVEDWHVIEVFDSYTVAKYEEYLAQEASQIKPPSCTYKTTTAVGAACAADMFAAYVNYLTNQSEPDEREQQYITRYTSISRIYSTS